MIPPNILRPVTLPAPMPSPRAASGLILTDQGPLVRYEQLGRFTALMVGVASRPVALESPHHLNSLTSDAGMTAFISSLSRDDFRPNTPNFIQREKIHLIIASPYFKYRTHLIPLMKTLENTLPAHNLPEVSKQIGYFLGTKVCINNETELNKLLNTLRSLENKHINPDLYVSLNPRTQEDIKGAWGSLAFEALSKLILEPRGQYKDFSRLLLEMRLCKTTQQVRSYGLSPIRFYNAYSRHRVEKYRDQWLEVSSYIGQAEKAHDFFNNLDVHYPEKSGMDPKDKNPFREVFELGTLALAEKIRREYPEVPCDFSEALAREVTRTFFSRPCDFPNLETLKIFFQETYCFKRDYPDCFPASLSGYFTFIHGMIGSDFLKSDADHLRRVGVHLKKIAEVFPRRAGFIMSEEGRYVSTFGGTKKNLYQLVLSRGEAAYEQAGGIELKIIKKNIRGEVAGVAIGRVGMYLDEDTLRIVSLQGASKDVFENEEEEAYFNKLYGDGNVIDTLLMSVMGLAREWGFLKVSIISDQANWPFYDAICIDPKRQGYSLYNLTRDRFGCKTVSDSDFAEISLEDMQSPEAWDTYRKTVFCRDPKRRRSEWSHAIPKDDSPSELSYQVLQKILSSMTYDDKNQSEHENMRDRLGSDVLNATVNFMPISPQSFSPPWLRGIVDF